MQESNSSNFKLQKTISNLIANVIASLCQQVVQYEKSIEIFGLFNLIIDSDVEVNVKLNEKFIKKKDLITTNLCNGNNTADFSKLINDIQSSQRIPTSNNKCNQHSTKIYCESELANKEIISESFKRRPRKPNQTFKHVVMDENTTNGEFDDFEINKHSSCSEYEETSLKIDINSNGNNDKDKTTSCTNHNDDMDCEDYKSDINPSKSPILNVDDVDDLKSVDDKESSNLTNELTKTSENSDNLSVKKIFRCSVCDRQFKRKFCLTRHKRIHQSYKTYSCNNCGLVFEMINQLKRHLRSAHPYSRENLRKSCRTDQKSEENTEKTPLCCSKDCSWNTINCTNSISSTTSNNINNNNNSNITLTSKASTIYPNLSSFVNSNDLAKLQSNLQMKRQLNIPFAQALSVPSNSTVNTNFQVRQMLNSIMLAVDQNNASGNFYNQTNPLYFMQPYAAAAAASSLLPNYSTTNNGISTINNSNNSSAISAAASTASTPNISSTVNPSNLLYRFPANLINNINQNTLKNTKTTNKTQNPNIKSQPNSETSTAKTSVLTSNNTATTTSPSNEQNISNNNPSTSTASSNNANSNKLNNSTSKTEKL